MDRDRAEIPRKTVKTAPASLIWSLTRYPRKPSHKKAKTIHQLELLITSFHLGVLSFGLVSMMVKIPMTIPANTIVPERPKNPKDARAASIMVMVSINPNPFSTFLTPLQIARTTTAGGIRGIKSKRTVPFIASILAPSGSRNNAISKIQITGNFHEANHSVEGVFKISHGYRLTVTSLTVS